MAAKPTTWTPAADDDPLPGVGEVHLWRWSLDVPTSAITSLGRLLSADERTRANRFKRPGDRGRFIVGRASLRILLGRASEIEPSAIIFRYGLQGKPLLSESFNDLSLQFNLAHSGGVALLAVAREARIGVDIEEIRPMENAEGLMSRFFAPAEAAEWNLLAEDQRLAGFFHGWTRKEAYIKATGQGLSQPLKAFAVSLSPGRPSALVEVEGDPEEVARWSILDVDPGPGYSGAIAVEGRGFRVRSRDAGGLLARYLAGMSSRGPDEPGDGA